MLSENCWLPNLEYYDDYNSWNEYEDALYAIFKHDFLDSYPQFENTRVNVRHIQLSMEKRTHFFTQRVRTIGVRVNEILILDGVNESDG